MLLEGLNLPEALGYLASGLVFLTFCMRTLIPLRIVAILSNVAFIAYGWVAELAPVLILHAALLPLNLARTWQQARLRARVRAAARDELRVEQLLPFMARRRLRPGEVVFRRGDPADFAFYLAEGAMRLEEMGKEIGPGALIGEIGLFSGDGTRTATVVAATEAEICVLTQEEVLRLYHQNPEFGFFLIRLVTARLLENYRALESRLNGEPG